MTRLRRLALLIAVALSIGIAAGCGIAAETTQRTSQPAEPTSNAPMVSVAPPDAALADGPVAADAARSVVKVRSVAQSCRKILEGSGVVIGANRVISAAHAVAGAESVTVSVGDEERPATVVSFDPNMDIAILDVPELAAPPLQIAHDEAPTGTDVLVLGYPGGGPFVAQPARIREVIQLTGPDIYRTTTVNREVYAIRGEVGHGDSGGPLIDLNKRVLGINFGSAADDPETGFALTAEQVYALMVQSAGASGPVATGACVR